MSWNGSGSFNRLFSWVADKTAGLDISSTRMDADSNDIASNGFGNCLTRDGQGIATANLPMGGFKHTGVANGSSSTDYCAFGQFNNYTKDVSGILVTTGTSTAYAVTTNQGMASPANGQEVVISFHVQNGASPTLAADGGSAIAIQLTPGFAVPAATIDANTPIPLKYSSAATAWIMFQSGVAAQANAVSAGVVTNAGLANASAWTLKGNNTGSSAAPTDFTIDSLTAKSVPTTSDEVLIWDAAASAMKKVAFSQIGNGSLTPTVQRFTSGSGTYTATIGTVRVRVRIIGAGGGGSATATNSGSGGGNTSFGAWTAIGGGGGINGSGGGAGGTGGATGAGTLIVRISGNAGSTTPASGSGQPGATGGSSPFGSGGAVTVGAGSAASAPGAGGSSANATGSISGGGGSGEYVEFWATAAQATGSSYSVGGGGNGGAAGTNAGGAGAAGLIIVEELYT